MLYQSELTHISIDFPIFYSIHLENFLTNTLNLYKTAPYFVTIILKFL